MIKNFRYVSKLIFLMYILTNQGKFYKIDGLRVSKLHEAKNIF